MRSYIVIVALSFLALLVIIGVAVYFWRRNRKTEEYARGNAISVARRAAERRLTTSMRVGREDEEEEYNEGHVSFDMSRYSRYDELNPEMVSSL